MLFFKFKEKGKVIFQTTDLLKHQDLLLCGFVFRQLSKLPLLLFVLNFSKDLQTNAMSQ